jgi:hypothetical protein
MTERNEGVRQSVSWTTPAEIMAVVHRRWARGDLLGARLTGEALFPMSLPLRRPHVSVVGERVDDLHRWIHSLQRESRASRGAGYDILWVEVESRRSGRVNLPSSVVIPSAEDALQLIGKTTQADRFDDLARRTLKLFPQLQGWLIKNSLRALRSAEDWESLMTLVAWFQAHPRPQVYLRQIDLPGVDTNFIQEHRAVLAELLNEVLPEEAIDRRATNVREFDQRYGLLSKPALVRLRVLDGRISTNGLMDITVPTSHVAQLSLTPSTIFVTKSEINGLAFPETRGSIVIFGLPYDDGRLAEVPWLRDRPLHYWDDIDAEGFANLDRMRTLFPHTASFLMDRETFLEHQRVWTAASDEERPATQFAHLSADELALLDDLVSGRFGVRARLEQERICYRWLRRKLEQM